ncbi:MAG: hypothetical protein D6784_00805 [Chloroflexi bacterium]|nr:MAG: hypothetical protein D6784_00805 [Chloroflexota bacterium]
MLETIEQAVKVHDKYQFEIKLDYELLPDRKTHYRISTYIFIPKSLGINPLVYSRQDFYRDVKNYIRLKTPVLLLRDFTTSTVSPLTVIRNITAGDNWVNDPVLQERLVNSMKLLQAMLKSAIRDHFNLLQRRVQEAPPGAKPHLLIENLVEEFLTESEKIAAEYRKLYAVFNLPNVAEKVFTTYKLIDEAISLLIEESAVEMFQIVDAYMKKSGRAEYKQRLGELVDKEIRHRQMFGYRAILNQSPDNEEFIFRASVLKKFAASVLFLSTDIQREGATLEQLLYAVAAGISMIFATVVAFYFQQAYGSFTFPVFIALVVGYMFKDRIKELGRQVFARYLQNVLFDRRITIRTQNGRYRLGTLREKVSFITEDQVPRRVLSARNRDFMTNLDNDGQGEYIICYSKEITLFTDTFKKMFPDLPDITGINDIMRYDIRAYLNKMDEPVQERRYLEAGEVKTALCHKVYHLNFVSKYTAVSSHKEKLYRRTRLVLNREGIKRVEHVSL